MGVSVLHSYIPSSRTLSSLQAKASRKGWSLFFLYFPHIRNSIFFIASSKAKALDVTGISAKSVKQKRECGFANNTFRS